MTVGVLPVFPHLIARLWSKVSSTYGRIPTFLDMCERSWHLSSNKQRKMGMVSIHCLSYCYWDKIPWSTATCGGWGREEVSFTHISIQQSIIQSSPESGRNLGAVRDVETLEGCSLLTCSVCLSQPALFWKPGSPVQGVTPQNELGLPHWSLIWKTMLWRNFFSWGSPSLRTLALAKLTQNEPAID